ncbi:hypothetical protein [Angustibacter luteus]|uniref:Flp family type IVb pilin n=1 Tax=Angustibacter luteus TaxID=658456 RepID=A0ABW1J8I3_9ACTN
MTKALVAMQVRAQKALESRESGQGTLEYVGMIVAVAVIVGAVVLALNNQKLGDKVTTAFSKAFPG